VRRLLHLNGPPGIGKSTLARRYAADHPGVLVCDIDVLRTFLGGWQDDFAAAGRLIRPTALAMIASHLAQGHDVVLPQLLLDPAERARFRAAATDVGATYVERLLLDTSAASVARFHRRGGGDPWHDQVRAIVADQGGDAVLVDYDRRLRALDAPVVTSVEGDVEATYAALLSGL
jgi:predicted kinase